MRFNKGENQLGIRVLIVDDAAFMRMLLKGILEKGGYEVVGEAKDGVEAVDQFKVLHPQVITMDMTMPDMDGIQAVKEIMAIDSHANIVMVSAMGQQAMVVEAMEAGVKDFIVKPFQADRILDILAKILKGVS
jgi:two-component system chemotaxis response regulator CheY